MLTPIFTNPPKTTTKMNIIITRYRKTAEARCTEPVEVIDGHLLIDGQKICDTAENANGALPEGEYEVTLLKCKQYKRKMLVLSPACPELCRREGLCLEGTTREASVTGGEALGQRTESKIWLEASTRCDRCPKLKFVCNNTTMPIYCPMLKPGNGVHKRLDGSIILGTRIIPGCLKHPKQAFDSVYGRIRKSIQRGNQVLVTIKNEFV